MAELLSLRFAPRIPSARFVFSRRAFLRRIRFSRRQFSLPAFFIARRRNSCAYVRVSTSIADPNAEEREYRPFASIRDGCPRFLFTLDPLLQERGGVHHLKMVEFMVGEDELLDSR